MCSVCEQCSIQDSVGARHSAFYSSLIYRVPPNAFRLINKMEINSKASTINVMNFCIGLLIGFYWWEFVRTPLQIRRYKISHRIDCLNLPHEIVELELRKAIKSNGIPDSLFKLYFTCAIVFEWFSQIFWVFGFDKYLPFDLRLRPKSLTNFHNRTGSRSISSSS